MFRLGQTGIHLGVSLGLEGADLLSIIADSRVCRMRLTERYLFIHIHSGVRIHVEAALFSNVKGWILTQFFRCCISRRLLMGLVCPCFCKKRAVVMSCRIVEF